MPIIQRTIQITARPRGFHLITAEIIAQLPELRGVQAGLAHLFLQHTSASLLLNENADMSVRADLQRWCQHVIPDGASYFEHDAEGPDDMPAHVQSALFGVSLTIPVQQGAFALGTWQGITLGEHRRHAPARQIIASLWS